MALRTGAAAPGGRLRVRILLAVGAERVSAELFDPQTETFSSFTSVSIPRHYHGSALLLPDGRVAVAGHTKEFNKPPVELNRKEVEVISPPYLFRGPRQRITNVAHTGARIGYGQDITVSNDRRADIAHVAQLRPGSATDQLNTDQRYVALTVTHPPNPRPGARTPSATPSLSRLPAGSRLAHRALPQETRLAEGVLDRARAQRSLLRLANLRRGGRSGPRSGRRSSDREAQ